MSCAEEGQPELHSDLQASLGYQVRECHQKSKGENRKRNLTRKAKIKRKENIKGSHFWRFQSEPEGPIVLECQQEYWVSDCSSFHDCEAKEAEETED